MRRAEPSGGLPVPRTLPKFLTESQLIALVRAPDLAAPEGLRDRAVLAVLAACGLRASELCGLLVRDVTHQLVFVRAGKFGHQRFVPISPAAYRAVAAYLAAYPAHATEPLFRTGPGRPLTRRRLHKIVDRYALALRLPRGVHTLRSSAATRWLNRGVNINLVRVMLGHVRLATTAGYIGVATDAMVAEYQRHCVGAPAGAPALG
jgi:integrase/recombinase XerD